MFVLLDLDKERMVNKPQELKDNIPSMQHYPCLPKHEPF